MISRILIANRGEIALRIIRAARELNIEDIVVYSEADKNSLPVRVASKAVKIGPAAVKSSYLYYQNILSAAKAFGADGIHPGYGFFAENPSFVEACNAMNIKFIGPNHKVIQQMGNKSEARKIMKSAGVPVIPGSDDICDNLASVIKVVKEIDYPIILKASAGGGGKGVRIVRNESELKKSFQSAKIEAENSFGNGNLYVEKFIENAKHIEVQVLADKFGNSIHLFERDCSLQRKHQKLLEEAPAPKLDEKTRNKIYQAALKAVKAVNYDSVGTVEFLLLPKTLDFYFMEMNTRIQVEHPVTEEITGIDLIKEQIKIGSGDRMELTQSQIKRNGFSIECRINAENTDIYFAPTPGKITEYIVPGGPGIRVDSGVFQGYSIPPYYDSMIAKLIAYGNNRQEAIARMKRALDEFYIDGVKTTISFHKKVLGSSQFLDGNYTTESLKNIMQGF